MSRNKELTERFPELATIDKAFKVRSAILDGEIVGLDENDFPCFEDLQNRKKCFVVYGANCMDEVHYEKSGNEAWLHKGFREAVMQTSPVRSKLAESPALLFAGISASLFTFLPIRVIWSNNAFVVFLDYFFQLRSNSRATHNRIR